MSLTTRDLDRLHSYGIDDALIIAAGIRRVTHAEARDLGMSERYGDLAGVVVPRIDPTTGQTRTWRLRRDHPRVDEHGAPIAKYLTPAQDRQGLYFPPGAGVLLVDVAVTVVLVEADWSALAVTAATARSGRRLLTLGIGGCWGWRTQRAGKAIDADGARVDVAGPVPDVARVTWRDRDVVVLLDANATTNKQVQAAQRALVAALTGRGACVRIGTVPAAPGVNGPDDYRAAHDDAALLALIDDASISDTSTAESRRESGPGRGPSQATLLVDLAREHLELWHTPSGDPYATVVVNGHREHHPLRRVVRDWLSREYYRRHERAPNSAALTDAIATLGGMARYDGLEHAVSLRLAEHQGAVYLDLGDPDWRAVSIDASGWRVMTDPPVRYWRPASCRPLPAPVPGGRLDHLRELWPLDDDAWDLVVVWLVAALQPQGPYPVLVEIGEQGAGKSTLGRQVRGLIDPAWPELRGVPRDERDVMIGARNSRVLALDNLSGLPIWLSDALCRIATGGGLATRALYTDVDETLIDVMRPILLTGIEQPATRGDLLDRALVVTLPPIQDRGRRDEADLWARYHTLRPALLGALCDAVSVALRRLETVRLARRPRMADACRWVTAAAPALGWMADRALTAMLGARDRAAEEQIEGDPVAAVIRGLDLPWRGTAAKLLADLNTQVPEAIRTGRSWPGTPRALSGALRRLAPSLRRVGIDVSEPRRVGHDRQRVLDIVRIVREEAGSPSQARHIDPTCADNDADDLVSTDTVSPAIVRRSSADPACVYGRADDADDADDGLHTPSRTAPGDYRP